MAAHATYSYDVLIIGAGGAGLRAAIEAANAGVSVGLICKSLLGKAHTVMAEGGMAAAMAHNDDRDSWKVHFADTMRGGQYVNNWRMAEIHAKEAPDRVRELEAWGAVFDRTPDGRINQRNFGGHRYPRLAHVGDRTGLELIRTLQDHTTYLGVTVHMEHTVIELILDGGRAAGVLAYDRERGRFHVFSAKAIVLATGGVGRAYKVTSNSWEGTGDGHALAYRAGAELIDMEFIQFHPTGMVWPPSVKGILVTEGVRGEGGVLRNSEGRRFMFDDIPDNYKPQTASDPEEGWRYTQGDKSARRPPELLTRDHVARCINREVKAGRGSPHGGVFLDIAWIKEKISDAEGHIKRKLPSMYHQFKELADLDITKEPMEVGPTTHYIMGGIRVNADTQESTIPGLVRGGRVRGRHQRRQSARRQFAVGPDRVRQARRRICGAAGEEGRRAEGRRRRGRARDEGVARAVRSRRGPARIPTRCSTICRTRCRRSSASSALENEMQEALVKIAGFSERASRVGIDGHREFNAGWHTCIDLRNLLDVSEAIARSAIERKESRGGHFREDFPDKKDEFATFNFGTQAPGGWDDEGVPHSAAADSARTEAGHRGAETVSQATFSIWRSEPGGARRVQGLHHRDLRRHGRPRRGPQDPGRAGAGPGVPLELQGRQVRIVLGGDQRQAAPDVHEPPQLDRPHAAGEGRADAGLPADQGPRHRRVVELPRQEGPEEVQAAPGRRARRHLADAAARHRSRPGIPQVHRVLPVPGRLPRAARSRQARGVHRAALLRLFSAALEMHPLDTDDRIADLKDKNNIGYCNITKCCTKVCPEHIHITDNAIIPLKETGRRSLLRSGHAVAADGDGLTRRIADLGSSGFRINRRSSIA